MRLFKIFILSVIFWPVILTSQNLVPNYSFEDTVAVKVTPLYLPKHWDAPTREGWNYMTPFNNLSQQHLLFSVPSNFAGHQQAKTGNSYALIMIYDLYTLRRSARREYAQVKLERPLVFDSTYCMQLFISLADSFHFASRGQLGVYFSSNAVGANNTINLPYTPQVIVSPNNYINDKVNWVEYNMQYTAAGGEEYITMGNFYDTTSLDTQYVAGGGNQITQQATYYYIDDVWLSHCDSLPDSIIGIQESKLQNKVSIYPNPVREQFTLSSKSKKDLNFQLFDVLGKSINFSFTKTRDEYFFSVGDLPKGIYLLQVSDGEEQAGFKIIKE